MSALAGPFGSAPACSSVHAGSATEHGAARAASRPNVRSWRHFPSTELPDSKRTPAQVARGEDHSSVICGVSGDHGDLAAYLATNATWKLGVAQSLPWPRCVQHVTGEPAMVDAVAQTVGAIRCGRSAIQDPGFAAALIQGVSSPSPVLP